MNTIYKMSNQQQHVFVAMFSKTCSACIMFKRHYWENFLDIKRSGLVLFYYITEHCNNENNIQKIPEDLKNYKFFWPIFLLCTRDSWDRALRDPNASLQVSIFNGPVTIEDGKVNLTGKTGYTPENLMIWIKSEIENNPIFNQPKSLVSTSNVSKPVIKDRELENIYIKVYKNKNLNPKVLP